MGILSFLSAIFSTRGDERGLQLNSKAEVHVRFQAEDAIVLTHSYDNRTAMASNHHVEFRFFDMFMNLAKMSALDGMDFANVRYAQTSALTMDDIGILATQREVCT